MTTAAETGQLTGTADKDYNLIWSAETCLNNALRLQTYIQDAERAAMPSWLSCSSSTSAQQRRWRAGQGAAHAAPRQRDVNCRGPGFS
jgi:hypothetical protein